MAQNDIPAQASLSKKSLVQSGRVVQPLNIHFTAQNEQACAIHCWIADRHPILRAQIHAGHIDYVKRPLGMLFIVQHNGLLQLRQRAQVMIALQLLLAFAAGKNKLALPWRRIGFLVVCHSAKLDAVFL